MHSFNKIDADTGRTLQKVCIFFFSKAFMGRYNAPKQAED